MMYSKLYAGQNEFYRWGRKAIEKLKQRLTPNENGFYAIEADGGKYWAIGVSQGQYGYYAKYNGTFFSVNSLGHVWAKEGTPKAQAFVEMINNLIQQMKDYQREIEEEHERAREMENEE